MKIYVGYIGGDYASAACMGLNKEKVQEMLDSFPTRALKWVEEYNLKDNRAIELDTD